MEDNILKPKRVFVASFMSECCNLMLLIIQWIRLGVEIWSDMWGSYSDIAVESIQHNIVSHQYNLADLNAGMTINHVDKMWQWDKATFKSMFSPKIET